MWTGDFAPRLHSQPHCTLVAVWLVPQLWLVLIHSRCNSQLCLLLLSGSKSWLHLLMTRWHRRPELPLPQRPLMPPLLLYLREIPTLSMPSACLGLPQVDSTGGHSPAALQTDSEDRVSLSPFGREVNFPTPAGARAGILAPCARYHCPSDVIFAGTNEGEVPTVSLLLSTWGCQVVPPLAKSHRGGHTSLLPGKGRSWVTRNEHRGHSHLSKESLSHPLSHSMPPALRVTSSPPGVLGTTEHRIGGPARDLVALLLLVERAGFWRDGIRPSQAVAASQETAGSHQR